MSIPALSDSTTKQFKISSSTALAGNTLLTGLAVGLLFGTPAAVACMVTNVVLAQLSGQKQQPWFPIPDNKVVQQIKDYWENSPPFFATQAILGIAFKALGVSVNQLAINFLRDSLSSPYKAIQAIFRICILAPLVEETIFRGFFQEKIQDVQVIFSGKKEADSLSHTISRVAIQAIFFAALHFHPAQGLFNILILLSTGYMGFMLGLKKEETSNVWSSTAMHTHLNTSVTGRVCLFGT